MSAIELLYPPLQAIALRVLARVRELIPVVSGARFIDSRLGSTWRDPETQWALYTRGREQLANGQWRRVRDRNGKFKPIVTNATPEQSAHCHVVGEPRVAASLAFHIDLLEGGHYLRDAHPAWALVPAAAYLVTGELLSSGAFFASIPGGDWAHLEVRGWKTLSKTGRLESVF